MLGNRCKLDILLGGGFRFGYLVETVHGELALRRGLQARQVGIGGYLGRFRSRDTFIHCHSELNTVDRV